jgi:glycogen synthase
MCGLSDGWWFYICLVGGIYTVIKTKAPVTVHEYGENYFLIGPYSSKSASLEVEVMDPPFSRSSSAIKETIESIRACGINIIFGRWLIDGYPSIILFDVSSSMCRLEEWQTNIWDVAGIPSGINDHEMNEAIAFGYLVAWFLGEVKDISLHDLISC